MNDKAYLGCFLGRDAVWMEWKMLRVSLPADLDGFLAGVLTAGLASSLRVTEPEGRGEERGRDKLERKERLYIGVHLALENKCRSMMPSIPVDIPFSSSLNVQLFPAVEADI
jgi:hypothetical protein